jgi:tRNA nucleotidyltransferase/poly(A) polymerase
MSSQSLQFISQKILDQWGQEPKFVTAKEVCEKLQTEGFKCYFVGGCVRDLLIGRKVKDFDLATSAKPEQIEKLFPKTLALGKAFGIISVIHQGIAIEVATFRKESSYVDGRHPEQVQFTDEKTDALRRDFTVNALYWDPKGSQVIDYVDGVKDIQNKILRAVGDAEVRFSEDYLRMIRLIRFQAQMGFEIEIKTLAAFKKHFIKALSVSAERLTHEFSELINGNYFLKSLGTFQECEFFQKFFGVSDFRINAAEVFEQSEFKWAQLIVYLQVAKNPERILKIFRLPSQTLEQIDQFLYWFRLSTDVEFQDSWYEKIFSRGSMAGLELAQKLGFVSLEWRDQLGQVFELHGKQAPKAIVKFNDLPLELQKPNPETGQLLKRIYWIQLKESITDKQSLLKKGISGNHK